MMKTINANTKIAFLIKQHPDALDAIVSLSPKFEKLRNPILRKLMAGRASIAMASKIGGCSVSDFFVKLKDLGFEVEKNGQPEKEKAMLEMADFLKNINPAKIVKLDVRPVIEGGNDPLQNILEKIKTLQPGEVLEIVNTFEPTPLIFLLKKQGFDSYVEVINENLIQTYFYRVKETSPTGDLSMNVKSSGWEEVLQRYSNRLQTVDVRQLQMPLPMMTILEAVDKLPEGNALFVYHKRIPVFLLPELAERKLDYRINEVCEGEVHLLIFKP
ncbi:MAG: DUF2249 domain-containing protein [Chitinophagaceae bacterium]|nr:DUF2249 domain-containing protein [Chitinophagaceae bacterium]